MAKEVDLTLPAKVEEDGTLTPEQHTKFKRVLKRMANEDNEVEVSIRKIKKDRTAAQNRYYWGVVVLTIMYFFKNTQGEEKSKAEVHGINLNLAGMDYQNMTLTVPDARGRFVEKEVIVFNHRSTAAMNTKEFSEFIETLKDHWGAVGCIIPEATGRNYQSDFVK
jgi:hypothetical protein